MGFVNSSIIAQATTDTTPKIYNIALGPVSTEQSQALPANTKEFIIKSRDNAVLQVSYEAGKSGTEYIKVNSRAVFTDSNLYASVTLYFQSPQTGDVVEIVAYT